MLAPPPPPFPSIEDLRTAKQEVLARKEKLEEARIQSEIARNLANAKSSVQGEGGGGGANKVKQG